MFKENSSITLGNKFSERIFFNSFRKLDLVYLQMENH